MEPIVKKSGVPIKVCLVLPKETKTVTLPYKENNDYQISELREAAGGAIDIKTWRVRFAEIHYSNKLILFDNDLVWVNFEESSIVSARAVQNAEDDSQEPSEAKILTDEDSKHQDMIMHVLGHANYFVNKNFSDKYLNGMHDDLPNCVVTECAPLIKESYDDVFFVDYLTDEYHEYMKQALDFYHRVAPMFQSSRAATRWLHSFYRPMIDSVCLHRIGSNVGQRLQVHSQLVRSYSDETQNKFAQGMTPDLTDGWLFRYKSDSDVTCLTPDDVLLPSVATDAKKYSYQLGDDTFMLIDFLMELRRDDTAPDRFKALREAAGCLACFRPFISGTKVFFGTGDKTRVRFYFVRDATDEEDGRVFCKEIYSNSFCTLNSYMQTAAFLWRLKQYRLRQYRRWFGLTYYDQLLHHTGLQSLKNSSEHRNITDFTV